MKKILLPILFILCGINIVKAQNSLTISGILADRTDKKGLPYTTAILTDTATKMVKSSTFTNEQGKFLFDKLIPGVYFVTGSALGYSPVNSIVLTLANSSLNIDTLYIDKSSKNLKEVTVAAAKPLLEVESDKMTYNVENDVTLQGMTALDALKKLPFVTVDGEDNIQMKGSSNFKVLLNGKSTSIVAKNPSEALKAFPTALIKKIEVITEPSAKYDAEGTAGIINIITQKKIVGYNGNVYLNYNNRGMNNLGGSLNVKWGKLGFSSYLGANTYRYINQNTTDYTRITKIPGYQNTLNQFSKSDNEALGYWGNFELAYDFDTLHTLSIYASPNGGNNKAKSHQETTVVDSLGAITEAFTTDVSNTSNYPNYDIGLDFVKIFKDHEEHELSFSALRDVSKDNSSYTSLQNYLTQPDRDIFNTNVSKNTEYTFNIDYSKPFKNKSSLESGGKIILRQLNSDYKMMQRQDPLENYTEVAASTNVLSYNQNVGSLYSTFEKPIKTFKLKLGARVEQTWINASFNKDSTPIQTDYLNFIPTASLSTKIKKSHTLRLNYSKRIQRPWMFYLNPYVNNQNPRSISYGNPNLVPEKTHSVSLSWNYFFKQNSLDISLSNSFTDDVITSFTTLATDGVATTSFYNIAKTNTTGINIGFWGMLFGKMQLWAGYTCSYVTITHKLDAARNRSGFSNRGHGNVTWNFKYGISSTLGGWVWQGAPTIQSIRPLNYNYNLAVRKAFFKKKLNVGIVANNFLEKTQSLKTVSEDPNFTSVSSSNNLFFRYYSFSVSYNFGKMRESVSRKKGVSNDDTKGGE